MIRLFHPDDYKEDWLQPELAYVAKWSRDLQHQHEHRRWEYALGLHLLRTAGSGSEELIDVGGAGSPFTQMLAGKGWARVYDPEINGELSRFSQCAQAIFCVSVIEHLPQTEWFPFIDSLASNLATGGLLYLTSDCLPPGSTEDKAHFHWMRKSFFTPEKAVAFAETCEDARLSMRGEPCAPEWRGPFVYDYNFVAMAFVKR